MMLKTTLIILIFFISLLSVQSQVDSINNFLIGGRISFNHSVTDTPDDILEEINTSSNNFFHSSLYLGKKINNKSIIGVEGSYSINRRVDQLLGFDPPSPVKEPWYGNEDIGLSLFYRNYLFSKNNLMLFLEPSLYYSTSKRKEFGNKVLDSNAGGLEIDLGLMLRISKRWNILANIWGGNYEYKKNRFYSFTNTTNTETDFNFAFNLQNIRLGAEWMF